MASLGPPHAHRAAALRQRPHLKSRADQSRALDHASKTKVMLRDQRPESGGQLQGDADAVVGDPQRQSVGVEGARDLYPRSLGMFERVLGSLLNDAIDMLFHERRIARFAC